VTVAIWLLFLLPLGLALAAQNLLRAVFRRYRAVPNHGGVTGAEVARALLDAHGLQDVRLEVAPGFLSDHYDGDAQALRLSDVVARERSVAALGIAAHEVSHAYQDAEGSRAYRARHSIGEQLAQIAPWSGLFLIGGFWFGAPLLVGAVARLRRRARPVRAGDAAGRDRSEPSRAHAASRDAAG
jgi:Zn-dependent membrane protease YugP